MRDDERSLELKLGLPCEEQHPKSSSVFLLGHFAKNTAASCGAKRGFVDSSGLKDEVHLQQQSRAELGFELSLRGSGGAGVVQHNCEGERRASAHTVRSTTNTTTTSRAVAHARPPTVPVVGWPPIRNTRKIFRTSSLKQASDLPDGETESIAKPVVKNVPFVKINMEGILIGRKVNLTAYDSYEKLAAHVKELFHRLLEAQKDASLSGKEDDDQIFARLLDGTGKYTLVYEDNEGDRILAGDVPWNDFVSSAKRLRVLKTSEISNGTIRASGKRPMDC